MRDQVVCQKSERLSVTSERSFSGLISLLASLAAVDCTPKHLHRSRSSHSSQARAPLRRSRMGTTLTRPSVMRHEDSLSPQSCENLALARLSTCVLQRAVAISDLRAHRRRRARRAIRTLPRSDTLTGSIHLAPMGTTATAQPVRARQWATTPTGIAWCFRWRAISTDAASRLRRHRTVFCRVPRVACTPGSKSGAIRK